MTNYEVKQKALELMQSHGLISWNFSWHRSKRVFGRCIYGRREITMSQELCNVNTQERIMRTVLHEIAHALCGPRVGHGPAWKAMAVRIGCPPARCFSEADTNLVQGLYIGTCPNCKKESHAHKRRRKLVACGVCCRRFAFNRFDQRFVLSWRVNTNR